MLSTVTKLLRGFIPKLSHAADGLIFQVLALTIILSSEYSYLELNLHAF